MKKTKVRILLDDNQYHRYKAGETGYVDGYSSDKVIGPLIAVIIKNRVVYVRPYEIEVITPKWKLW